MSTKDSRPARRGRRSRGQTLLRESWPNIVLAYSDKLDSPVMCHNISVAFSRTKRHLDWIARFDSEFDDLAERLELLQDISQTLRKRHISWDLAADPTTWDKCVYMGIPEGATVITLNYFSTKNLIDGMDLDKDMDTFKATFDNVGSASVDIPVTLNEQDEDGVYRNHKWHLDNEKEFIWDAYALAKIQLAGKPAPFTATQAPVKFYWDDKRDIMRYPNGEPLIKEVARNKYGLF